MLKQSAIALIAASSILVAGASLAQAETSGQADIQSSNANVGAAPTPMAHGSRMMHKPMMKKKMHHKAM